MSGQAAAGGERERPRASSGGASSVQPRACEQQPMEKGSGRERGEQQWPQVSERRRLLCTAERREGAAGRCRLASSSLEALLWGGALLDL